MNAQSVSFHDTLGLVLGHYNMSIPGLCSSTHQSPGNTASALDMEITNQELRFGAYSNCFFMSMDDILLRNNNLV